MIHRLLHSAIPIMGRTFYSVSLPHDLIICEGVVLPAVLFFLILLISFLIVFIIACTARLYTDTHSELIQ